MEGVRKARPSLLGRQPDFGEYQLIDYHLNAIIDRDVDIEALGRETGALKDWESLG